MTGDTITPTWQATPTATGEVIDDSATTRRPVRSEVSLTRWGRWAVAVVLVVALAVIGLRWQTPPQPQLAAASRVVVAELANKTGEPIFDDTLRQALVIELEQSPYLRIASDQQLASTLQRMRRRKDARLELPVALEVCRRDRSSAVIAGSIVVLAREYVITLEAIACEGAQRLTGVQVTARSREAVLSALGKAGTQLRLRLGESLSSVRQFDRPLAVATTHSLEALKAYSAGMRILRFGTDESAALPLFERATTLDDNFAMAYAYEAMTLSNLGESARAAQVQQKAYALRDRVSERERQHIISAYHRMVTGNLDQEMATYQTWSAEYPHDWIPVMRLGEMDGTMFGSYAQSTDYLERARQLGSGEWHSESQLAIAYLVAGRLADAKALLADSLLQGADNPAVHGALVRIACLTSDAALLEGQRSWSARQPAQDNIEYVFEAVAASRGRLGEMRGLVDGRDPGLMSAGLVEAAALDSAAVAVTAAEVGAADDARKYGNASLAKNRARGNLPLVALSLAFLHDQAAAETLVREMEQRFPEDVTINRVYIPLIRALLTDATAAVPAQRYGLGSSLSFMPLYVSGITKLRAGQGVLAATDFQTIIQNRAVAPLSAEWALAHLWLARARAAAGDVSAARSAYETFLELWKSADAGLPILEEAKHELAALSAVMEPA